MFKEADIVKSKIRTDEYPKFVIVLEDENLSNSQFKGVVMLDEMEEHQGDETDNFNTSEWELSSWEDMNKCAEIQTQKRLEKYFSCRIKKVILDANRFQTS